MKKYLNLRVFKMSEDYVDLVYELTDQFPKEEQYCVVQQIRRAAISITNNIAEGSSRRSKKDFIRFLEYSNASCSEVQSMCRLSSRRKYINDEEFQKLTEQNESIQKQLFGLMRSLSS